MRTQTLNSHNFLAVALALTMMVGSDTTLAQSYPSKPVRLVIAAPPGGVADLYGRVVSTKWGELLGQPIVLEYKPGANNNIGAAYVARAQPDGYTLLWAYSPVLTVNPSMYKNLGFDPQRDFVPVRLLGWVESILVVHNSVQANSLQELIALLKSKPGAFNYATGGIGSLPHLAGELFKQAAGVDITHVPYVGAQSTAAALAGEPKLYFATPGNVVQYMKVGTLKAMATTGPKRAFDTPAVPTFKELGFPDLIARAWHGVIAPAGTPKSILARLNQELSKVMSEPEVQETLKRRGLDLEDINTPEDFASFIKSETLMWAKIIKGAGIQAQ